MTNVPTFAQQKPNIVIIWGDDVGQSDISTYSRGLMGFKRASWHETDMPSTPADVRCSG